MVYIADKNRHRTDDTVSLGELQLRTALLGLFLLLAPLAFLTEKDGFCRGYCLLVIICFFCLVLRARNTSWSIWKKPVLPEAKPYAFLALAAMLLGGVMFFLCIGLAGKGSPEIRDGICGIWKDGVLVRELSEKEYYIRSREHRLIVCAWAAATNGMMLLFRCKADRILPQCPGDDNAI